MLLWFAHLLSDGLNFLSCNCWAGENAVRDHDPWAYCSGRDNEQRGLEEPRLPPGCQSFEWWQPEAAWMAAHEPTPSAPSTFRTLKYALRDLQQSSASPHPLLVTKNSLGDIGGKGNLVLILSNQICNDQW